MENFWLPEKIARIDIDSIKCEYSKMIIDKLASLSQEFEEKATENYKDNLDLFFARDFRDKYIEYAKSVLDEIIKRVEM